ncbi:hypothetical protein ETAA8_69610 [Anatilimnocola aggregata]|uniref:Uncharacterized protein n=1 Tax=Anatilimnocola aggregata TaxID=2528021 RepID=A0A517YNK6_9BACT|nr:hypothetical protein [Anatilimnocola aggregata]QDU31801.1 hypothetical protein ETAA8_69610 [Anatilimnocola aggregata]
MIALTKDEAIRVAREQDTFAALAYLSRQADPIAAAKLFSETMLHLYWQEKDLPLALAFGRAGAQFALTAAETNEAVASDLRSSAKALTYNLASFTWRGWDEPGIEIGAADMLMGLDAAKANLRLALELKKGDLPLSRAHWMLGAQQLAAKQLAAARDSFAAAERYATVANTPAEALLAQGFAIVVRVVAADKASADRQTATDELERCKQRLRQLPDGDAFCGQFDSALKVFAASESSG